MNFLKAFLFLFIIFSNTHSYAQRELKVGVVYALSGTGAAWGATGRKTLELTVQEINEQLKNDNLKISLSFEDSQSQPKMGISGFNRLTEVEGAQVIIGDVWQYLTVPLISLAKQKQIPLISPTQMYSEDSAIENSDYFFSLGSSADSIEEAVDLAIKDIPAKTAIILCWDDYWGNLINATWKKALKKNNVEVLYESCQNELSHDYRLESAKIASLKPDLVLMSVLYELVAKQVAKSHPTVKFLTTSDVIDAQRIRFVANPLLEGVMFTDWPMNSSFINSYKNRWGSEPAHEAQNHQQALYAIAEAFKQQAKNGGTLYEALKTVKFKDDINDIDFSRGSYVAKRTASLYEIKSGKILKVVDEKTGSLLPAQ